jgi:trigger factor
MKVEVKKEQDSRCTVEITIEAEKVEESYAKNLQLAARNIAIPGFRKGKAPIKIAERHINKELLMRQILEELAAPALQETVEKENLTPLTEPAMDVVQFEKGKALIFKTSFEIKPEAEIENYTGLEITQEKPDVKEDDVEQTLKIMQENAAQLKDVEEDRGIRVGDFAVVDFESTAGGVPIDKGSAKNYLMEMKEDMFIPGFVDNLKEMKKGEERKFTVIFPEDYATELKGKKAEFAFKIHTIKSKVLSELNDDFAKEVSTSMTIKELREDLKAKIQKKVNDQALAAAEEKIADELVKKVNVSLPASLIAYEQEVVLGDIRRNFAAQGIDLFQYFKSQGKDVAQFMESLRPQAERLGKLEMALEAISNKENLSISEDEVEAKIKELAEELKSDVGKLKETLKKEGRMASLKYSMLKQKTMSFLVEKAKITYVKPEPEKKEDASAENKVEKDKETVA